MMRKLLKTFLLLALGANYAVSVFGQKTNILTLANQYSRALKNLENEKSKQSVEAVYRKGALFSDKLDELENLSEADYALFEKKLKGFIVN